MPAKHQVTIMSSSPSRHWASCSTCKRKSKQGPRKNAEAWQARHWETTAQAPRESTKHAVLRTYWCGWEVDEAIPDEHMMPSWPAGMRGWRTGFGVTHVTWAGRVDAESPKHAEQIVRSCYGESARWIVMRWEPREHELGWRPGDRFPE